ncbi:hypothetical protein LL037_18665 [Clostridium estertheticum]|uniref:hypothetical protein n=1 Tax=Clostridium estertheticum TaxID=238834 RepID=UPI001C0E1F88|nr:hypothetical protein [Clostridium estertheticum]MBU3200305.1 hypothetical protein [Clostridium estertheticum]WAG64476.1 hypothetical protein LL037_18665 [Clostridium estertheticum]
MKEENEEQYFNQSGKYTLYHTLLNELNQHPIKTNQDANIQYYHNISEKFESIKGDYIDKMINLRELQIITDTAFNTALEPLIPKCIFDSKTEVFRMDFNFVPYLKIDYLKKFVKIKNALMYLIMESINQMKTKPKYKEPVLIIFSISKKFLFDVDNIEIKYIIDSLRYSHFFEDDSYNYISYMVEGKDTKEGSRMTVTIIKKSTINHMI